MWRSYSQEKEAKNGGDLLSQRLGIAAAWCLLSALKPRQAAVHHFRGARCDGEPHLLQPLMPLLKPLGSLNVFCEEDAIMTQTPDRVSFVDLGSELI